jgi:CspA family cold shock protein
MNLDNTFTGKIKFFNKAKGFGFIIPDKDQGIPEKDIFYHVKNQTKPAAEHTTDDPVTFNVQDGRKGPEAVNVSALS